MCKGCGECVQGCGDHDALRMTVETEDLNAHHTTAQMFSRLLPDTPQKFLGLYQDNAPQDSREDEADTTRRIEERGPMTDETVVEAIVAALRQDAFNHGELQAVDGRRANGMSVMFMGASTGCNTVYGSTPPSNPHPCPCMNSLFQDGATVSWLLSESVILDHARRSVVPERLAGGIADHAL